MRLRAILFALTVLGAVGATAWRLADAAASWFEATTASRLETAFDAAGQTWVEVAPDGTRVTLAGAAPDETTRFRALEIARQVVAPDRITDATTIAAAEPLAPPPFALELLRNESEISLIGLVPETGGRDVIRAALGAGGLSERVTDMLESASDPAPEGWREALGFGLSVLSELPRAKISVGPGKVKVIAVADSDPERSALEARLGKAAPEKVALTLEISSPRPVIAPFAFDFALAGGAGTLAACSAETEEDADAIVAAARGAGLAGPADCAIGLGAPSPGWAAAVVRGLDAVTALGGGGFAIRDISATLTAPEGTTPERLAEVRAGLDAAIPDVFQLAAVMPPQMETRSDGARVYAPRFDAVLGDDGRLRLSGPVKDQTSQAAIESFAAALFGHERVSDTTGIDTRLPDGWPVRVLAGIEALAKLNEGKVEITPERIAIEGWGLDEQVADTVAALLDAKVGGGSAVNVTYNAEAAALLALAARPRPEICAEEIDAILDAGSIVFARGSADIVPESRGIVAAIADVLRGCPGAAFEIGGHTDSQGSADANLRLSEERAQAVLTALRAEDVPLVSLRARGFGAEDPVADNATAGGRARNRRIEFTLVDPNEAPEPPPAPQASDAAPAECVAEVADILAGSSIQFGAGSATIAEESRPVIEALRAALGACPDAGFEVGGHTDSQGSDSGNLRLSQQRAEAVVAALRTPDLPLPGLTATGYGEADPVADNATAEGRAANRRIVFKPLAPPDSPDAADTAGDEAGEAVADPDVACAERIAAILAEGTIEFEPGSATIAAASGPLIAEIAGTLRTCPEVAMEVGGHTDSTGSESGNLRLSQERADAVLAALRAPDLPLPGLTAQGHGEGDPIADNATADGRARNRRIDFSLETAEGDSDDGSE